FQLVIGRPQLGLRHVAAYSRRVLIYAPCVVAYVSLEIQCDSICEIVSLDVNHVRAWHEMRGGIIRKHLSRILEIDYIFLGYLAPDEMPIQRNRRLIIAMDLNAERRVGERCWQRKGGSEKMIRLLLPMT